MGDPNRAGQSSGRAGAAVSAAAVVALLVLPGKAMGQELYAFTAAPPMGTTLSGGFGPNSAFVIRATQGATLASLAGALADHGEVVLLHAGPEEKVDTEAFLADQGVPSIGISYLDVEELDTAAAGNYFPLAVTGGSGLLLVDPKFFQMWPADDAAGSRFAAAYGTCAYRIPMFMERGHIETDGQGLCVVSTKIYGTNPGLSDYQVDNVLHDYLGCQTVIVLQSLQGDGEGRLDVFFRFATASSCVVGSYEVQQDSVNRLILSGNRDKLQAALPAEKTLLTAPMPTPITAGGTTKWPSYLAFLTAGDTVLVPVFADDTGFEDAAMEVFYGLFHPAMKVKEYPASGIANTGAQMTSLVAALPSLTFDTGCTPPELICDSNDLSSCKSCFDECEPGGIWCKSANVVASCVEDAEGCATVEEDPCPENETCENAKCKAPPTPCELMPPGGKCEENVLVKCAGIQVIKIDCWESAKFCEINAESSEAQCVPWCLNECENGMSPECSDDFSGVVACELVKAGCLEITATPCPDGTVCKAGACVGTTPEAVDGADVFPPLADDPGISAGYGSSDGCNAHPAHPGGLRFAALLLLLLPLLGFRIAPCLLKRRIAAGLLCVGLATWASACGGQGATLGPDDAIEDRGTQKEDVPVVGPDTGDSEVPVPADIKRPPSPDLASIETILSPEVVKAGEKAAVTCEGFDAGGNACDAGTPALFASPGVSVISLGTAFQVFASVAGIYDVTCRVPGVQGIEENGAKLTVVPAAPSTIGLVLSPKKDWYAFSDKVTVTATGQDAYGNAIDDVALGQVAVDPPSMGKVTGAKVSFLAEGKVTIWGYAAPPAAASAWTQAKVDNYAPSVEMLFPKRASAIKGNGAPLEVTGKATDLSGVASVSVNGEAVTPNEEGQFTAKVSPKVGVNLLEVVAEDAVGHETRYLQSFLYAGDFAPGAGAPVMESLVDSGIVAFLDYDAFAGDGSAGTSFSYLAQEFLLGVDVSSLVPTPAAKQSIAWCTYDVYLDNLSYGPIEMEVWPAPAGLTLHVEVPSLYADLNAVAGGACPDVAGNVYADSLTFDALASVFVDAQGKLVVSLGDVEAQFVGLEIELYGVTGAVLEAFIGFFKDSLTKMIEGQFEAQVAAQFESELAKFLGAVNIDKTLPVPPFMPGAPPTEVEVHAVPDEVQTEYKGVTVTMDAAFTAPYDPGSDLPGSMKRAACLAGDNAKTHVEGGHYFEAAIHHDVVNQMLYSVWQDGGVNMTLDAETMAAMGADLGGMGVKDAAVAAAALLPPVAHDCGADHKFRIEIGDMRMDVEMTVMGMPLVMTMYMYLSSTAGMVVTGPPGAQQIEFQYGEVDWMEMYIESINEEWKGNEATFAALIEQAFVPQFMDMLKKYPYVIPVSDLPLGDFLPAYSQSWTLVPVVDAIEQQKGQVLIRAHIFVEM